MQLQVNTGPVSARSSSVCSQKWRKQHFPSFLYGKTGWYSFLGSLLYLQIFLQLTLPLGDDFIATIFNGFLTIDCCLIGFFIRCFTIKHQFFSILQAAGHPCHQHPLNTNTVFVSSFLPSTLKRPTLVIVVCYSSIQLQLVIKLIYETTFTWISNIFTSWPNAYQLIFHFQWKKL